MSCSASEPPTQGIAGDTRSRHLRRFQEYAQGNGVECLEVIKRDFEAREVLTPQGQALERLLGILGLEEPSSSRVTGEFGGTLSFLYYREGTLDVVLLGMSVVERGAGLAVYCLDRRAS